MGMASAMTVLKETAHVLAASDMSQREQIPTYPVPSSVMEVFPTLALATESVNRTVGAHASHRVLSDFSSAPRVAPAIRAMRVAHVPSHARPSMVQYAMGTVFATKENARGAEYGPRIRKNCGAGQSVSSPRAIIHRTVLRVLWASSAVFAQNYVLALSPTGPITVQVMVCAIKARKGLGSVHVCPDGLKRIAVKSVLGQTRARHAPTMVHAVKELAPASKATPQQTAP